MTLTPPPGMRSLSRQFMSFPFYPQYDAMDCGPACLRMIAKFYGKSLTLQYLRDLSGINRDGVSLLGISESAEKIGFRTLSIKIPERQLDNLILPCILHWQDKHFVVLFKVKKAGRISTYLKRAATTYSIADPSQGLLTFDHSTFLRYWQNPKTKEGIGLLLEPTTTFDDDQQLEDKFDGFKWLLSYGRKYSKLLWQVFFALLGASLLQLATPFLTQSIVDVGINTKNLKFIYLVVAAQMMLFLGRMTIDFIRSWIILHISARINVSILSEFFIKLLRLPLPFFDVKLLGDIIQRIADHNRIENFLTGASFNTVFSILNLLLLSTVLIYYQAHIFTIFLIGSACQILWISYFLGYRKKLDYRKFDIETNNQSKVVEMIQGIQDIKLSNSEKQKRWEWESLQSRLFSLNIKSLTINQYQQAGTLFINETKNIVITLLSAKYVIDGTLTFGSMLAIQYVIGQVNSPIDQLIQFLQSSQDAKLSLERLREIHLIKDEDVTSTITLHSEGMTSNKDIVIQNVSFKYPGTSKPVLDNISLVVPAGKVTAIVGMSGSGKTTFIKLLLKFYEATVGEIKYGDLNINSIAQHSWRNRCGVVLQDGYIFSDSIMANIAMSPENVDMTRIQNALVIANLEEFINSLPLGLHTKIGAEGNGLSQGQKQRVLIARAVYKNPDMILFDEATNSLDANNESIIMKNLQRFFEGRTVVIVAHRLSTVRKADNILVLQNGHIVEQGAHKNLVDLKGAYYTLVKNQLELGS